jgi:hypothetical protein
VLYSCKVLLAVAIIAVLVGCKSTDQPQFADIGAISSPAPAAADSTTAVAAPAERTGTATGSPAGVPPQTPARPSAKIIIKGTKAGATQDDIAVALMAATRKLGMTKAPADAKSELRLARQAADVILGGDRVVLEGASADTAESIAEDLRKAGLLVTTAK